jgi:hypothetical protein
MENKIQSLLGGRVALSVCCEGHIETTSWNQTKYNLKRVGFDTPSATQPTDC